MVIEGDLFIGTAFESFGFYRAAALGVDPCLTKMVGKLELNASQPTDFAVLRELYWVFMGGEYGGGGKIVITNAKSQEFTYTNPIKEELKKGDTDGAPADSSEVSLSS